jgi:aryl-alcohol dehydrogenase-like predicted oxidoreductase
MKYRGLGRSGVRVSEIGLGTNQFGGTCDQATVTAIVDRALGLGVNFIDSAESYAGGRSEETLGVALKGRWSDVVLATKTGARGGPQDPGGRLTRKRIVARLEASLQRLGTDYVDVYYFHFPDESTPLEESLRAMDDLVRDGKIRYPACSNYPAWQVAEMMALCDRRGYAPPVASQLRYNLLDRAVEAEMLPACEHFGLSFIPYSPLAGGFLTGKYRRGAAPAADTRFGRNPRGGERWLNDASFNALERLQPLAADRGKPVGDLAIAWLLSRPVVSSVIAGAVTPEQVEEHVRAAEWVLSPDETRALDVAPAA